MRKSSTRPKGATSYKETVFGILPRTKLLQLEIEGIKRGLGLIYTLLEHGRDIKINPDLICKLHAVSFQWIFSEWAGAYRKIPVTYSGKDAPPSYQISELILNLCRDLAIRKKNLPKPTDNTFPLEAVKILAWFQHRFVWIHPFQDYNGRTARMLTVLLLQILGLPPSEIKIENQAGRRKYLKAMQEADNGDLTQLEELLTDSIVEALKGS